MKFSKMAIVGVISMGLSGVALAEGEDAAEATTCDGDCDITATGAAQDVAYIADEDGAFVVSNFTFAVSSNVGLASTEDNVAIAVGTASQKGRNAYTGSSNGGSVTTCGEATIGSAVPEVPEVSLTNIAGCTENGDIAQAEEG